MLGKRSDVEGTTQGATANKESSSLLRLSKYEDAQYLQDNRLTAIDARQLWEGAKKGLALFFMNMPRSEQQMRAALKLFKEQVRDQNVL